MAKKIIQDIIVKKKHPPEKPRLRGKANDFFLERAPVERVTAGSGWRRFFSPKIIFWILLSALFVFTIFFILNSVSSTLIKITPKQKFVKVDSDFKARRGSSGEILPFETMKMERVEAFKGKSMGVKKISQKASGRIVIYNAYSSRPQTLVARTRFKTPDGKIFRIKKRFIVPGAEVKGGKIIPSSIEAEVYADKPGKEYNIGRTDFTIPGFKGGPRYEKFYARSKTDMEGGFDGTASVITENDVANAKKTLEGRIRKYLTDSLIKQKPDGFLLYNGALVISFSEPEGNPRAGAMAKNFEYRLKGAAVGFLFKKTDLQKVIVKKYLKDNSKKVGIANIGALKFTLLKRGKEDNEITFNLKGAAHFVWDVDTVSLVENLINAKSGEYNSVFKKYSNIEKAEIIFKPSLWRYMPKNKSHIHFKQILKSE